MSASGRSQGLAHSRCSAETCQVADHTDKGKFCLGWWGPTWNRVCDESSRPTVTRNKKRAQQSLGTVADLRDLSGEKRNQPRLPPGAGASPLCCPYLPQGAAGAMGTGHAIALRPGSGVYPARSLSRGSPRDGRAQGGVRTPTPCSPCSPCGLAISPRCTARATR